MLHNLTYCSIGSAVTDAKGLIGLHKKNKLTIFIN